MTLQVKEWTRDAAAAKRRGVQVHERAYRVARHLVGVMEKGGNNVGPEVTQIIRANGGTGPEPWCGDFVAFCYRIAGSNQVNRRWAAVVLLRAGTRVSKGKVVRGDIVKYHFAPGEDHTGLFVRWLDSTKTKFEAIEGNTGTVGAVSDSTTGGDGVYLKVRSISQVHGFRHLKH